MQGWQNKLSKIYRRNEEDFTVYFLSWQKYGPKMEKLKRSWFPQPPVTGVFKGVQTGKFF